MKEYELTVLIHPDLEMNLEGKAYKIQTLDISAGGMKIHTDEKIDIEGKRETFSLTIDVTKYLPDTL